MKKPSSSIDPDAKISKEQTVHFYPELEEKINIITHGIGFLVSIFGAYLLLKKSVEIEASEYLISSVIYSIGLMSVYAASTLYHSAKDIRLRRRLNIVDHAAIFLLIAGTYTPFTMITLKGTVGWSVFAFVWAFAFVGIILKLFYTGRYRRLSTIMYVFMGWLALFVINPLIAALPTPGLLLLLGGGLLYTTGAIFFSIKKIKFNHAIFHFFVLGGSLCHFLSIYFYV